MTALAALWLALGAANAAAPRPVQLALDAVQAAPAAARPVHATIPALVASAIKAGDPVAFHAAAVAHDYQIPAGDEVQERLAREGAERHAADSAYFQLLAEADFVSRGTRLSTSPFKDIDAKRRALEDIGITGLRGAGAIGKAPAVQVGKAFEHTLASLRRKQGR